MMLRTCVAVSLLLTTVACKKEVASVELTPAASTLEAAGASTQLTAASKDKEGQALADRTYTFKSSDEKIATVDATGKVTAKSDGEATITVTDADKSAIAKVFVAIPSKVEIIPPTLTLKTGDAPVEVQARVLDGKGRELAGRTVTFAVDKPTVATVEGNKVTAVGVGTATLTASSEKLNNTATIIVTEGDAAPAAEAK